MTIKLTIVLTNSSGGERDRTELEFAPGYTITMQDHIHGAIRNWTLAPGDTIQILGNEEAFDKL